MPSLLSADVAHGAIVGVAAPWTTSVLAGVPVGATLFVLVGDGFGYGNHLTGVTDSQGNVYAVDFGAPQDFGSVYLARAQITTALTPTDTITLEYDSGAWDSAYVVAVSFDGVLGLDNVGTPTGGFGPTSLDAVVDVTAGDLALGFACYRDPVVTDDPAWTEVFSTGDADNQMLCAYQIASANGTAIYTTSSTGNTGDSFSAAIACAYLGGGGASTISAGAHLTGIVGS